MFDVRCLQGMLLFSEQNFLIPVTQDCWITDFALKNLKIQLIGQSESLVHEAEIPLCYCRTEMTGLMDPRSCPKIEMLMLFSLTSAKSLRWSGKSS